MPPRDLVVALLDWLPNVKCSDAKQSVVPELDRATDKTMSGVGLA